ncbi:MAG: glutamate-1-semialdehyde 2,1-aminomutase [Rubricoccaceae bacterium]|nr:glutamate-1-semialdehyde 2,1-aminomutase [Rubricoccaceae bacterium]
MVPLAAPTAPAVPEPLDVSRWACSVAHQAVAHRLIPGGCHTYAKGDDQMPEWAPVVVTRGEGCRVWDLDGNAYIEYGMGLRAVTLGHAEPRVVAAVRQTLGGGVNFTRPAAIEREAAEAFLALVPGAERVKFCKDGSDATTAALRLARAATGRDLVAVCASQPFFSADDWFIGTTPMDAGIPEAVKRLTVGFPYGDIEALDVVLAHHPGQVAAVILEPSRDAADAGPYLRAVQRVCRRHGAVLVFDEMITGLRWHPGGAQTLWGVTPDLACFGKALGNGFSVSALCGRRELMERGGLGSPHPRVFLLSATHGAETHALAAACAVMQIYQAEDVTGRLHRQGRRLREGVQAEAASLGLGGHVEVCGRDCNLVYVTRDAEGRPSQAFRTLFLQELVGRGVLAPSFVVSAAHDDDAIDRTVEVVAAALRVYRQALDGGVERFLIGRSVKPTFRRHG